MCRYMEKVCVRVFVLLGAGEEGVRRRGASYHFYYYNYTLNAWASIDAVVTLYFHCSRCSCCGLPAAPAAAAAAAGQPLWQQHCHI